MQIGLATVSRLERANGFHADYKQPVTDLEIRLEAAKSLRFLRDNCIPTKRQWHGSYGLKHKAERWVPPYISNGALILAAVLGGFAIKRERINAAIGLRYVQRYKRLMRYPAAPDAPHTWRDLEKISMHSDSVTRVREYK